MAATFMLPLQDGPTVSAETGSSLAATGLLGFLERILGRHAAMHLLRRDILDV